MTLLKMLFFRLLKSPAGKALSIAGALVGAVAGLLTFAALILVLAYGFSSPDGKTVTLKPQKVATCKNQAPSTHCVLSDKGELEYAVYLYDQNDTDLGEEHKKLLTAIKTEHSVTCLYGDNQPRVTKLVDEILGVTSNHSPVLYECK
jgi:hypothetical protein